MSAPPALVSLLPALGTSCGGSQSSDSGQHPPSTTSHQAQRLSPKPEHHGHSKDRTTFGNKRNGKPEEHLCQLDSDMTYKLAASDQKPKNKDIGFEKHHFQTSSICEAKDSQVEQTHTRKSPSASQHSRQPSEESFDNSLLSAHGISTCDTPSRMEVSSVLEKASHSDGDSVDDSSHFDNSVGSVSYAEEELSTAFASTLESSSRDDMLDSTREGETSEADETLSSCQITRESMLESSLNDSSRMEETSFDASNVSDSGSLMQSQPGRQGTFF